MTEQNQMTADGQVTIPQDVRDLLGLKPGELVAFERNAAGEVLIKRGREEREEKSGDYEARYQDMLRRIDEAHRKYPMIPMAMTTDEYMAMIREPVHLPTDT